MGEGYCASRVTHLRSKPETVAGTRTYIAGTAAAPEEAPGGQFLVCGEHRVAGDAQGAGERPCRRQPCPSGHAPRFDRFLQSTYDLQRERLGPMWSIANWPFKWIFAVGT